MAHCDADFVSGTDRIFTSGAPLWRVMPNGCLGNPAIVLASDLDGGILMDVFVVLFIRAIQKLRCACSCRLTEK